MLKGQAVGPPTGWLSATYKDGPLLIVDIGGYFAKAVPKICAMVQSGKIIGIVEDTENGHQRYFAALRDHDVAVWSVARSTLKQTEDYNVGKSLVRAADSIMRKDLMQRLEDYACIGVIGFGKIGSSIAQHLRSLNVAQVCVYDWDPVILMRAASFDQGGR